MILQTLLPAALAFIMFALGLSLTVADFAPLAQRPRAVAVGLVSQMLLLPAVAWLVVLVWAPPPEFAVGLIILAACPGGATSNLLTQMARGYTALAVTLTAITSLAGAVTVPLMVNAALMGLADYRHLVTLPILPMVLKLSLMATLPLILGMLLRGWQPRLVLRFEPLARRVSGILFLLIVIAAFASQWRYLVGHATDVLPPALALNVVAMLLAELLGRATSLTARERVAVVIETGMQNGALGIFIALNLLGSQQMMIPSIVYALGMNITVLTLIAMLRRRRFGQRASA